jgi:hypothetical protein
MLASACAQSPPSAPPAAVAPAVPAAIPARITEIVVPDFAEAAPLPDLGLGRRVAEDLASGMRGVFKGTVVRRDALDRADWKAAAAGRASCVVLFGTAGLSGRPQKALLETDLPKDGPFKFEGHGLAERKVFVMTLDLALVDGGTGAVLWQESFRESRSYGYAQEAPESALNDILPVLRGRIFAPLFGRPGA